jgi:hypothetical protein
MFYECDELEPPQKSTKREELIAKWLLAGLVLFFCWMAVIVIRCI